MPVTLIAAADGTVRLLDADGRAHPFDAAALHALLAEDAAAACEGLPTGEALDSADALPGGWHLVARRLDDGGRLQVLDEPALCRAVEAIGLYREQIRHEVARLALNAILERDGVTAEDLAAAVGDDRRVVWSWLLPWSAAGAVTASPEAIAAILANRGFRALSARADVALETGLAEDEVDMVLRHQAGEINRRAAAGEMDVPLAAAKQGDAAPFRIADMLGWRGRAHALLPVQGPLGGGYAVVAASPDSGRSTGRRQGGVKTNASLLENRAGRLLVRLTNGALTEIWRARLEAAAGVEGRRMTSALSQLSYLLGGYTAGRAV